MPSKMDPAVRHVTSGTFRRELGSETAIQFAAGNEDNVTVVNEHLTTVTRDEMFSWFRIDCLVQSTSEQVEFEWMLVRWPSGSQIDMNDSTAMQDAQKQGRIMQRGMIAQPQRGYARPAIIRVEKYKVQVPLGEEIQLLIRLIAATAGATVVFYTILEYRQVGY